MKKFKTKGELKALSVTDFSPPSQGFKFESEVDQHMKTSTGLSNKMVEGKTGHACVVCKKKFKTPSQLSYHEMYHTADEYKQVREEAAAESKQTSRDSISDSPDDVKEKPRPKPKTARKQSKPEKNPMETVQNSPKTPALTNNFSQAGGGKKKVSCEKCKKKFSDSMTLEYHKITFHAVVVKPKAATSKATPKSREFVEDSSDSETEITKTVKTPVKRKQESPKTGVKKLKRDTSSSDEDLKNETKKSNSKPAKRVLTKKVDIRDVKSKARAGRGRGEKPPAPTSSEESESDEEPPPRTKKPLPKVDLKTQNKSSFSSPKSQNSSKFLDEERAALALANEVEDVRLHFVSPKNEKVPCGQCGRSMANAAVLAYHEIRCTGSTIKRKLSQDSNRTLSTDSRADSRASIESTTTTTADKKAAKKPTPKKQHQPAKKFVKSAKKAETSESESAEEEEVEDDQENSRTVLSPTTKAVKKSSVSSSSEDEDEKKEDTVPEKTSSSSSPLKGTSAASLPKQKNDDFHSKFSSKGFTEIPPANLYREKLFSTKGSKVKCEFCGKSFKNEQVLGHHNIYCSTPKADKSRPKPSPAKSKVEPPPPIKSKQRREEEEAQPAKSFTQKEPEPRTPDSRPDFVERTIMKNRASQSPVDLILKKLTGGVNNHSNRSPERSTADDATNSGSESTGSAGPVVSSSKADSSPPKVKSSYAFTDSEDGKDKEDSEDDKDGSDKDKDVSEEEEEEEERKGGKVNENWRENERLADNKVSIYTSSEDENGDQTSDSGPKRLPAMHPNARHGVEILEEEMRRKKQAKKEKKAKKAKKKAKKAKRKRSSSESETESVVVPKPRANAAKSRGGGANASKSRGGANAGKSRGGGAAKSRGSTSSALKKMAAAAYSDSDSTNFSDHANSAPRRKTKKNPNYCFCDKPENNEMIGCDYCDMWYHPECLGLDEQQTQKLTESTSWMCPECVDSTETKKSAAAGKNGQSSTGGRSSGGGGRKKYQSETESESDSDYQ